MANYNSLARSNYFRVRDLEAFHADLDRHGIDHGPWGQSDGLVVDSSPANVPEGSIALFSYDGWPVMDRDEIAVDLPEGVSCDEYEPLADDGRRPGVEYDEADLPCDACREPRASHEGAEPLYEDISALVSAHLVEGDVAIFMEVGFEKMRYLTGISHAVNSAGESVTIDLDSIHEQAASLGSSITSPTY